MKQLIFILINFTIFLNSASGQNPGHLQGTVQGKYVQNGQLLIEPLMAANAYWLGTQSGTITDDAGKFHLPKPGKGEYKLVVSFIGYRNDTLLIAPQQEFIEITLQQGEDIGEVTIIKRQSGSYLSTVKPIKTEVITTAGLQKLACCNLAESFENSATVDVNYTDAISGARQIQMLGLAGIYSQLMIENTPSIRGLSVPYGLNHIPGPWMESIQISKGTSSVINGYESITGQINIELQKPEKAPRLFLNLYGNEEGRTELNLYSAQKLNDKWSTMLLAHGSYMGMPVDHNDDGFLDMPMGRQINLMNRWNYHTEKIHSQFGISLLDESLQGGQVEYYKQDANDDSYSTEVGSKKYQLFAKNGIMLERPSTSIGFITYLSRYEQSANFGTKNVNALQNSLYQNIIFQSYIGNTMHSYSTGFSFLADQIDESFQNIGLNRTEIVPGGYFQYNFNNTKNINLIMGIRSDYNSEYGWFITPRLHVKYSLDSLTSIRLSGGKGYRTVNIYSDNLSYMASSRNWVMEGSPLPEQAWNYGIDITKSFELANGRMANISLDFYRTDFTQQWVADLDNSPREIRMYNLKGSSFSNSFQAEIRAEPFTRFEVTAAWRINDVQTTYTQGLLSKPLISKHKGLLSMSYALPFNKWKFDFTGQYNGSTRIPSLEGNPVEYQRSKESMDFYIIHFQITKRFKKFDVYAGAENLTNFKQKNPIIGSNDPFGSYFDSSLIWGPVSGRKAYAGIRYTFN